MSFKNNETRAVNLFLANEEDAVGAVTDIVQKARAASEDHEAQQKQVRSAIEDLIRDYLQKQFEDLSETAFYDLCWAALENVDWWELAKFWMEETTNEII